MKKPHIVFICTDQQRVDTLRSYDLDTLCKCPNLDILAAQSIRFSNAYASCPVCSPARSSMQCGLYPSRTGIETNTFQAGCRTHEIADAPYLLSRRLSRCGYAVGYTGKWHLGVGVDKTSAEGVGLVQAWKEQHDMSVVPYLDYGTMPTDVGYIGDDFPGHGNGGWKYPQFLEYLQNAGRSLVMEDTTPPKLEGDHTTFGEIRSGEESTVEYFLVDRAIALTKEMLDSGKPLYMNLNFWGPHEPFYAPTEYLDIYRNMSIPPWKSFGEDPSIQPQILNLIRRPEASWDFFEESLRHYYACMTLIDAQVGRYLAFLKDAGIYDDTMIIFSSDHGDYQGAHGKLENKGYGLYDETAKIPLLIKPASPDPKCMEQPALVGTCDIYATILKAACYTDDDGFGYGDGRPLNGFFDSGDQPWQNVIVTEATGVFPIIETQRMYRKGTYKYIFFSSGREQLFDMESDPDELNDLSSSEVVLLGEMRHSFACWLKPKMPHFYAFYCKYWSIEEWNR